LLLPSVRPDSLIVSNETARVFCLYGEFVKALISRQTANTRGVSVLVSGGDEGKAPRALNVSQTRFSAASTVWAMSVAIVIGPTPPGTGV
jgi:hypothetical protein